MTQVVTVFGNFARAEIDHDSMGRMDLPIYNTSADLFENFFSNFKGNAIFSPGFLEEIMYQDCALLEFRFNLTQNYLIVATNAKFRFAAFDNNGVFGWVLSGGTPLEVTTPYTLAEVKQISKQQQYTQNFDVMIITIQSHEPRQLTRTASNAFTLATYTRTTDPFSTDWPQCCLFYKGRLYYANTPLKGTTVFGSASGDYYDHTIAPPTITDTTALQFTLADISQPINWLFPGDNSLIVGANDGVVPVNGGGVNTAITASTVEGNISSAEPAGVTYPLKKDGLVFYPNKTLRNLYNFKYDILSESFLATDGNFIAYDITQGTITKIRYRKDRNDLIYCLKGDGTFITNNFSEVEKINGWHRRNTNGLFTELAVLTDNLGNPQTFGLALRPDGNYYIERQADLMEWVERVDFFTGDEIADDEAYQRAIAEQLRFAVYLDNAQTFSDLRSSTITYNAGAGTITSVGASFTSGDVGKHIVYQTQTGYESGRFEIISYNSTTSVNVIVLQEPTANVYATWYMSFTSLSGLSQYNGQTIGVCTDGGYLADFTVSGGAISFDSPQTSVIVGYRYKGIIKSFPLGFQVQAYNTSITMKSIAQITVRCVASVGGKVGTSLYDLEDVQELGQGDLNYLPPRPIDVSKDVQLADSFQEDKCLYIVQDQPSPFQVCATIIVGEYGLSV